MSSIIPDFSIELSLSMVQSQKLACEDDNRIMFSDPS